MTGCLVRTFGGEIPHVRSAAIKNTCLITLWLLSLQLWLFRASHQTGKAVRKSPTYWHFPLSTWYRHLLYYRCPFLLR